MLNKIALISLLSVFSFAGLQAQSSPEKAVRDLKKGVLIVRLQSDFNKLSEIKRLMNQATVSERKKEDLKLLLDKTITERDLKNKHWMESFSLNYSFSEVLFAYDTLRKPALQNDGKNCFLSPDFEIDPTLSLAGRPFLMLSHGSSDPTTGSGLEGLIFKDSDFLTMKRPFPYFIKKTSFSYFMNKLFESSTAEVQNIDRLVKKVDAKLFRFAGGLIE